MTPRTKPLLALGLALAFALTGCKKEAVQEHPTPVPTPTPVPEKDVLGFVRGGAIWVMRHDGSQQRPLAVPAKGQAFWLPSPAPDGTWLAAWLSRGDGTQDLVRVELSGRVTQLTDTGAKARSLMKNLRLGNAPSVSPDGKRIVYSFNGDIWLVDSSGYNPETLIADGASWSPQFSPDGKRIAYVNGATGRFDLWVADVDSRDTWPLTDFQDRMVGQPRWTADGKKLMCTRSQGEESDVVLARADTEIPLADADQITRDRASASAIFSPDGRRLLFTSNRDGSQLWNVYSMDASGNDPRMLTKDGGLSPFWMRGATLTAGLFDSPARPTPGLPAQAALPPPPTQVPTPLPTAVTAAPVQPAPTAAPQAGAPAAQAGAKPAAAQPGASPAAPGQPPAKPGLPSAPAAQAAKPGAPQAQAAKPAPQAQAAPTQPPAKAAPLRLRLRASFNDDGGLAPAGLAELKKLSPRVAQYAGESVQVFGPLDNGPLKGRFPSAEARSKARAQAVAKELAKVAKVPAAQVKAQPYAPPAAGGPANSIQVYVELK